ncbi:hypothetical protein FRC10_004337 [Ceratobasidium sp. 414]|nr:hypothetical protein FRC10_004337 [Ceratobasidium sp. 414]
MVSRKSILKMHNKDGEQTMDMATAMGFFGLDATARRKGMLSRHVSFAAMAQVRMFKPTTYSNAAASSPHYPSCFTPNVPSAETPPIRSSVPSRRTNGEEIGETPMELDDETPNYSTDIDDHLGFAGEPYDGTKRGGEDNMDLTDTYQLGTPSCC